MDNVKGVALIGFYATSSDFLLIEQAVYRPLRDFANRQPFLEA